MKPTHFALIAIVFVVNGVQAQMAARPSEAGRRGVPTDSISPTITEAEARGEASRFGRCVTLFQLRRSSRWMSASAERRCADVGAAASARSGDFVVGGFSHYRASWFRQGYGKLAWNTVAGPLSNPPALIVRISRIDAPGESRVFEVVPLISRPAGRLVFYPSGIHVPSVGRWMFVATAGDSWGCFLYDLK